MKKNLSVVVFAALLVTAVFVACTGTAQKNEESEPSQLMVGSAVRDITPTQQMFPLFFNRWEIGGVLDSIHVRALAISSDNVTTLIICSETGRHDIQIAEEVARHTGLPIEAVFSTTSHSHAAPQYNETLDLNIKDDSKLTGHQLWEKYFLEQALDAADEALANMKPASVGIGYSKSYININRLSPYNKIAEDGTVSEYISYGYNPEGPSDKTVAAIRFNDENGNPIAFIINYGLHCTVMHANAIIDGKIGISPDVAGMVSNYLEEKYDGSVAVWTSGAAGDQAPIVQNMIFTRNEITGEQEIKYSDSYDILLYLSKIHFADIETALSEIEDYKSNVKVRYDFMESKIPAKDSGDYSISLQLLRIGDIALVGFPGEMFTPIGTYMKQNSELKNTVIVCHTVEKAFQNKGYHADDASIARGGPGTNAGYKPGFLTEGLTVLMNKLIEETNK